jgi:FtsZ-binding cell division protein ZapB
MKNILGRIGKLFIFFTYPILIVALIICITLLVIKVRELDNLNATFAEATKELNSENQDRQLTIEELKNQYTELTSQVAKLNAENTALKQTIERMQVEGSGSVTGRISTVLTADGKGISQYQRVCAELVSNTNIQVCRTVPALQQNYTLNLPVGNYRVYAEVFPTPTTGTNIKAYYTEYARCLQGDNQTSCNADRQKAPVVVEIKAGTTVNNIDPIDWRI